MTAQAQLLASGPGWQVQDFVCTARPEDRAIEEQHESACIAIVTAGTFEYRTSTGRALLSPGAILLGNRCDNFECRHVHARGDRCLAFHFASASLEQVAAALPHQRSIRLSVPSLPPLHRFAPLLAAAEAARDQADATTLEELSLLLAATVLRFLDENAKPLPEPGARDAGRITAALRRIERCADELECDDLSLAALAQEAGMSRFHFLRSFALLIGVTPHQALLSTRLRRAAVRLRSSGEAIASVAYRSGFGDLSTFNRQFRRMSGVSPKSFRERHAGLCLSRS